VDGTEELAEDAATEVHAKFHKKPQKTFSTIVLTITAAQFHLVISCEQARDIILNVTHMHWIISFFLGSSISGLE